MNHLLTTIGSTVFVFAFLFENAIGLGANLEANRNLMQDRVRVSQTAFGKPNEIAVDANMVALDQYSGTLKAEYKIYNCDKDIPCR